MSFSGEFSVHCNIAITELFDSSLSRIMIKLSLGICELRMIRACAVYFAQIIGTPYLLMKLILS